MALWSFRIYVSDAGRSEVEEWYRSLTRADRARVFARLQHLRDTPRSGWVAPIYSTYVDFSGMGRIRVGRYRMIGCFGPSAHSFTFVHAFMKNRKTIPTRIRTLCINRQSEIHDNLDRSHEWFLD